MSEKKIKEEKKAAEQPKIVGRLTATFMSNGDISVQGFPTNLRVASAWIGGIIEAVTHHYITEAKAGRVNEKDEIVSSPLIVPKGGPLIVPSRPRNKG